jgi:hypothetical protein
VEIFEGSVEPFIVSGESLEADHPREEVFHDPAAGQKYAVLFGHGMFGHNPAGIEMQYAKGEAKRYWYLPHLAVLQSFDTISLAHS